MLKHATIQKAVLEDMSQLLYLATGHDCVPMEGGSKDCEFYMHCTVSYYDCEDQLGHELVYNYVDLGHGLCRITDSDIVRDERFDHLFDLTRKRLHEALMSLKDEGMEKETLRRIGAKFGMLV